MPQITITTLLPVIFALTLILPLSACVGSADLPDTAPAPAATAGLTTPDSEANNQATIQQVDINLMESFPVQVNVRIAGSLPNSCVVLNGFNTVQTNHEFVISAATTYQTGGNCAEQLQPFDQMVSLPVVGLPAGTYTVTVEGANSVSNSFALAVDNVAPQAPQVEPDSAAISGIVWEDTCRVLADGAIEGACVSDGQGGYRADGIFDNAEARIPDIEVTLSAGPCSNAGSVLSATATDAAGTYLFGRLQPGEYCVAVDAESAGNAGRLLPGGWTYPGVNVSSTTVTLAENGYQAADFGWNRGPAVAPDSGGSAVSCRDEALFVADVTIPDGTVLAAGEAFEKTWRLQNTGSCTWGPDYSLVFAGGDSMSGPERLPLTQVVKPGETLDVSVQLVAPAAAGVYRSDWQLRSGDGYRFGSGGESPFYAQIEVE